MTKEAHMLHFMLRGMDHFFQKGLIFENYRKSTEHLLLTTY